MGKLDNLIPFSILFGILSGAYYIASHFDPWGAALLVILALACLLLPLTWRGANFMNEVLFGPKANEKAKEKKWNNNGQKE